MSLSELEARAEAIQESLEPLALFSMNTGVGPIGYRSMPFDDHFHPEWVQVDLGTLREIDQVVLVPTVWRSMSQGYVADGFPKLFQIIVGEGPEDAGTVVGEYDFREFPVESVAPLVFDFEPMDVSWVRVQSEELSARARDGKFVFQLAELMVFGGQVNYALHQEVSHSRNSFMMNAWNQWCLVDGILPYVMNAAYGEQSLPMISRVNVDDGATITVDLESEVNISRLRLHAVEQGDTIPQAFRGDFGIPKEFVLEGALESDFSDAFTLLDVKIGSVFKTGPILEWAFEERRCRYVRLIVQKPYIFRSFNMKGSRVGFAELELLNDQRNLALGKPVQTNFRLSSDPNSRSALTDGLNLNGAILPIREWMSQLAERRDLEAELPLIQAELAFRYAQQKKNIRWLILVAVVLAITSVLLVLYFRTARQRQEAMIRERIAANLHDELGANLHAIGLLGDLARDVVDEKEDLLDILSRMRKLTVRTGKAAINCANLLEADAFCEDLVFEIKQDIEHLLGDLGHELVVEGEAILSRLRKRTRIDLYLFHKEALTNIIRHSAATMVFTELVADEDGIRLKVRDNGHGLNEVRPKALGRRARLLGGDLSLHEPELGKGTEINLVIKKRKLKFIA